jgi:hypothetical protein
MSAWDLLAGLEVRIDGYALEGLSRTFPSGWKRITTTFVLHGGGEEGRGEDICYWPSVQQGQLDRGPYLALEGTYTLAEFSAHISTLDLFPEPPKFPEDEPHYRRWGLESAAADLALRQAGAALHEVLERPLEPVRFVVSFGLGDPSSLDPVTRRMAAYPWMRFKLDAVPGWRGDGDALVAALAATGTVDVIDFKGTYKGTPVDVETDPELYRLCAEALPEAWLEDPDLTDPAADAALEPHRERITWDAPIHSVADIEALAFAPRSLNLKPSRFGSWEALLAAYDYCDRHSIALYGGGQSELGVGRGQIQLLAAMFHADAPNDVAPNGYDQVDFPQTGLETSPLQARPEPVGFRRAAGS